MADCSELAENLTQIAMNLATREDIKTLDDVVLAMREFFPELRREDLVDAIVETTARQRKEANVLSKKLNAIRQEARSDKALQNKISELEQFLETGDLPAVKGKKPASMRITELRQTRDTLRKWIQTGDPAMKKKFNQELSDLTKQIEAGKIEMTHRKGKLHAEVQQIKDEIDALKKQISEQGKEQELLSKIEILQTHLDAGTLPKITPRGTTGTEGTQMLRSIIFDLRKKINRSEPARRKRIEKSIADLEQKLKSGDILPKPKPPLAESKELDQLIFKRDLIKKEIQDEIRSLKPLTLWGKTGAVWDLVRLMMTTGEFSFALRQGGIYAFSHPAKWSKALAASFRSFASPRGLFDVNRAIFARENAPNYNKSGLVLLREGMSLTRAEEVIMNYWADKLPVIRNFNRGAIGFFNTLRADMFDVGFDTLGRNQGMTQSEMEIWANYINVMSGRGKLTIGPMSLEPAALAFNRAFFSIRYVASRFQMLGGVVKNPLLSVAGQNKRAFRLITREYIRLGVGLSSVYALGILVGADIEEDPRSTNFGKLTFGNRRLDVLMGHAQVIQFMARLMTGKTKTGRGEVIALRGEEKKFGGQDIESVIARFRRSKLSPQFGLVMNILTGETYLGEDITLLNSTSQFLYPMAYGDLFDVMQEEGMQTNVSLAILTMLGMGLQTYESGQKEVGFGER